MDPVCKFINILPWLLTKNKQCECCHENESKHNASFHMQYISEHHTEHISWCCWLAGLPSKAKLPTKAGLCTFDTITKTVHQHQQWCIDMHAMMCSSFCFFLQCGKTNWINKQNYQQAIHKNADCNQTNKNEPTNAQQKYWCKCTCITQSVHNHHPIIYLPPSKLYEWEKNKTAMKSPEPECLHFLSSPLCGYIHLDLLALISHGFFLL